MNYFNKYISNYDMNDPDINYKYHHSYRVMDISEYIAKKLKLSNKDIYLAKIIGLYHDIGRFEQDKRYDSFKDNKMDHGNYGVKIIKEKNMLSQYEIDEDDYEIVYKAIKNHNKFKIEEGLNERELLFSKIIRDADKIDILFALGQPKYKKVLYQDDEEISKELKESFYNHKSGNVKNMKSSNDGLIITFSHIYDINFKTTYEIIQKEQYYEKIYQRIIRKDIFNPYLEYLKKYIQERID